MKYDVRKGLWLFWIHFKGMLFAFTSGTAALPTIERAIVEKKKWLTGEEFWTYPPLGQTLPGVISVHNAVLIGNRIAGPFGGTMAAIGVILPAFLCMLVIGALFQTVVDNPYIQGAIRGIRVISIVIMLGNAVRLLRTVPRQAFSVILVIIAVLVPLFGRFSAFWTIIACGAAGIISVLVDPAAAEGSEKGGS